MEMRTWTDAVICDLFAYLEAAVPGLDEKNLAPSRVSRLVRFMLRVAFG
jgi:hypothetical protein